MAKAFGGLGVTAGLAADRTSMTEMVAGQQFYETDTRKLLVYSGSVWVEISDLDNVGGVSDVVLPFLTRRIFTNEAARDAAITGPVEGQEAYLTASSVATAAGGNTAIPTGITTVYNGSSWVCITPVGARTTNVGTTTSLSFTTALAGSPGTNPSVTLTTGAAVIVNYSSFMNVSGGNTAVLNFSVSGATTRASVEAESVYTTSAANAGFGRSITVTGLNAGTNTFSMSYRTSGGTATFENRNINVIPIP